MEMLQMTLGDPWPP